MDILVYGAGVLGSLYAARLHAAGHKVALLARGQRLADLQEHGVVLEDALTGERTVTQVPLVTALAPDDAYELVLVIMRKNQVGAILPILAAHARTPSVLFMMNNAAGPDALVDVLGEDRVLLGFPGAAGERDGHVVRYLAREGRPAPVIGEINGTITPRLLRIAEVLGEISSEVTCSDDIDAWLKTHVALVSPIANALYMAGGDIYRLAETRDALVLLVRGIREGFCVLRALDVPITPAKYRALDWIPEPLLLAALRRMLSTEVAELGLQRHANAARDEMQQLAEEFRLLAHEAGVHTPVLDVLCSHVVLEQYPLPPGSRQVPLDWRRVWLGLGAVAAVGALLIAFLRLGARRQDVEKEM
ncbi:MAG: ketopantoate reductase family protein [Anaerolineae bacterium]